VDIPLDPTTAWRGAIIGNEVDDAVEKMAHVALTFLFECSLAATADTLIALFPIQNQDEPEWHQRHEAVCDLTSPNFSAGSALLAKYARYLFNL
jgi:hypothetical protein